MKIKDKILIVEDEQSISNFISMVLNANGYDTIIVGSGEEALTMIASHCPDLIVLDLGLPDMDGMTILRNVRKWSKVPILVVSARSHERDKVEALDAGADDYLTKPFGLAELTARVNSLVRRYTKFNPHHEENQRLRFHDMTIDPSAHSVEVKGELVSLTAREFDILLFLAQHKGRIFTKQQIYQNIWKEPYYQDDGNIMSIISKLRKKIEPDPEHPFYVLTVYGVGYRFNEKA